jgi:hypothetical protein
MGAAMPRTRKILLASLGLAALYALLLACYFPWRAWQSAREVVFEYKLPENVSPTMIFPAPSGWIFMNVGDRVLCYLPPAQRDAAGRLEEVACQGPVICMALDGDALYFCTEQQAAHMPTRSNLHDLIRLAAPPDPDFECVIDLNWAQQADLAAQGGQVYVISDLGELLYLTPDTMQQERWRLKLLPMASSLPLGPVSGTSAWGNSTGTTTHIAVGNAGIAYCLAAPDTVCAVNPAGEELWRATLPQASAMTIVLAEKLGQLFLLNDTGETIVLDCADGQVVWRVSGLQGSGYIDVGGFPAVGPDGSALTLDNNYMLTLIQPGGQYAPLTKQYEYNSHIARTADCGILLLGANELRLLDPQGCERWSRNFGSSLAFFQEMNYHYNQCLALSPDGVAVVVIDNTLYGFKPLKVSLAPARP